MALVKNFTTNIW